MADQSDCEPAVEFFGGAAGDPVRLGDGRDYDRRGLAVEYPELLAYADEHATLRETCPVPATAVARKAFLAGLAGGNATFGAIAVIVGWLEGGWTEALAILGMINVPIACVSLMFTWAHYAGFRRRRPRVAVRAGHVWVYQGNTLSRRWRVDEIEWYFGRFSDSSIFDNMWLPRVPVIVLASPHPFNPTGDETLGVGFTQEARTVWQQLLTTAGRTRRTAWEPRPWTWRRAARFAVGLGLIPAILATGAAALLKLKQILLALGLQNELASLAVTPLFVLTMLLLVSHLLQWPWKALERVPSPLSPDELRRARRRQFPLSCVPCVGVGLGLLLVNERGIPLAAKAPVLLSWTPVLLLAAWWMTRHAVPAWVWQKTLESPSQTPGS